MNVESVAFCEGCPAANGVRVAGNLLSTFSFDADLEGFKLAFADRSIAGRRTNSFNVYPTGDVASDMPAATAKNILGEVKGCEAVNSKVVKRLGGLLGKKTVRRCGAYPDQNPKKIKVRVVDNGWFHV